MSDYYSRFGLDLFSVNIYRYETSQTTASGSVSSTTLKINGGLVRQVLIRALTDNSTIFKANITEVGGVKILDYGYHVGELNDTGVTGALPLPVLGNYNVNITNASPEDTFDIRVVVQE